MQIPPQIVQLLIWRNGKKKRKQLRSHKGHIFIFNIVFSSLFLLLFLLSVRVTSSSSRYRSILRWPGGSRARYRSHFFCRNFFCTFCHPQFFVQTDRHFFHMYFISSFFFPNAQANKKRIMNYSPFTQSFFLGCVALHIHVRIPLLRNFVQHY